MEEKLIEAVRARKLLYDTSDEDYLKSKLKTATWEEVAKATGICNGTEAKTLWEKLRHSLRDALRRQQKCIKSGVPAESIKMWKFQKQMGFLKVYMANTAQEGNLTDENEIPSQICDVDDSNDAALERQESLNVLQGIRTRNESQSQVHSKVSSTISPKRTKKNQTIAEFRKRSMAQHEKRIKCRLQQKKKTCQKLTAPNDSLYHFFMSMYKVTKDMPQSAQFLIKNDIFRVVSDMEGKLLNISAIPPQFNTIKGPSYPELSLCHNENQSNASLSTPPHSSHSVSPISNL